MPTFWVSMGANVLNAFLNWVLIFGHLGAPAMGAVGAGLSTSILQGLMPFATFAWIVRGRLPRRPAPF